MLSEIDDLEEDAIIVAHSIEAAMLINLLAKEHPKRKLDAIALIFAPFIGEGGWPADEVNPPSELGEHLPEVPMFFYQGTADKAGVQAERLLFSMLLTSTSRYPSSSIS